jgi:hypothetical protein
MAKVLSPEQFRECRPGTVFVYGEKWCFRSGLLILDDILVWPGAPFWGFYATDPMWAQARDWFEADRVLEDSLMNGTSFPAAEYSTKYMSYDGDAMEVFLILERDDWQRICATVGVGFARD